MITRPCKDCNTEIRVFNTTDNKCYDCKLKSFKPLKAGKKTKQYNEWRDNIARPYLDKKYGRACTRCRKQPPYDIETGEYKYHDIDHINKRSTNPHKVMELTNLRYLCRKCHRKVTDGKVKVS